MFEYNKMIENQETGTHELIKVQVEEDEKGLALKKQLAEQISDYEYYKTETIYIYYHYNTHEDTHPLYLENCVFKDNEFIGYIDDGSFYKIGESHNSSYADTRLSGSTGIRKIR